MMSWLYYLLEANLYLSIFYCFYRLFLHKETFYVLNRYYLIISSFTAFIIPFFQLGFLKQTSTLAINFPDESNNVINLPTNSTITITQQPYFTLDNFFLSVYTIGAFLFLCKLCIGLFSIFKLIKKPFTIIENDIRLINLKGSGLAFSFFNLLFLDSKLPKRCTIIRHELVHIRQKHSLDVLFFEIIQIINWFNPFCYLLKKDIKLIHEYIADEAIIHQEVEKYDYAIFLIQNSQRINIVNLTNQIFSSSILKQRINMLNKEKTKGLAKLKMMLALPLATTMLYVSTMAFTKDYGYVDLAPQNANLQQILPPPPVKDQIKFPPPIVNPNPVHFFAKRDFKISSTHPPYIEKRYIVQNGKPITDTSFYGVINVREIKYLIPANSISEYGDKAKYGAVEITGGEIRYIKPGQIVPPPPKDQIKFRPPIIKKDKIKFPPVVKPDKAINSEKKDQIKRTDTIYKIVEELNHDFQNVNHDMDSAIIVNDGKIVELKGRKIKNIKLGASPMTIYLKSIPDAIQKAIKLYGPSAKNGVIVLDKDAKIEFEEK